MLNAVTGSPGSKKTAFVVSKLDKVERDNKVNLVKNKKIYQDNLPIIEKWQSDFSYYEYEVGSGVDIKLEIEVLDDDYWDIFTQDFDELRPDDYYQRVTRFNEICERVNEREGIQGFKGLLPVRTIYANINALKIDYIRSLRDLLDDDGNVDWRKAPDGSIIVIDEIQNVPPFDDVKNSCKIVKDLTIHRHRGFDFYVITQFPTLINRIVKVLIGVHYHLTVPYGLVTRVYQFGSCRDRPDTFLNKVNCETKFSFNPPDRIFKLYKSTTINTHKKRLPVKQLSFFAAFIIICLSISIYSFNSAKGSSLLGDDSDVKAVDDATSTTLNPFDSQNADNQTVNDVQAIELTRPAMIMASETSCRAYNSSGQLLDISVSDCMAYSDNPSTIPVSAVKHDITYDYFNNQSVNQDVINITNETI